MPSSVDSLVIMPDARNTFALTENNMAKFRELALNLFGNDKELHEYVFNEKGEWVYTRPNPLILVSIETLWDKPHGYDPGLALQFSKDGSLVRLFTAVLPREPKFALLDNSVGEEKAVYGLYLSNGISHDNPWVREESIFVINGKCTEHFLKQ